MSPREVSDFGVLLHAVVLHVEMHPLYRTPSNWNSPHWSSNVSIEQVRIYISRVLPTKKKRKIICPASNLGKQREY